MAFLRAIKLTYKACSFASTVGASLVFGAVKQTAATLSTGAKILEDINNKRYEQACERVVRRAEGMGRALGGAIESTCTLLEQASESKSPESFLNKRNAKRVAQVAMIGLGTGLLLDAAFDGDGIDADADGGLNDHADAQLAAYAGLDPAAVQNGMFVGDADDLNALIAAGEQDNAVHVDAEDVERSIAVRDSFLAMHGYDSVPEGWEVHHIVPLSEGGADSADNMILVTEAVHDEITAAHRAFYGWNA